MTAFSDFIGALSISFAPAARNAAVPRREQQRQIRPNPRGSGFLLVFFNWLI
jgi:hypothetical protein